MRAQNSWITSTPIHLCDPAGSPCDSPVIGGVLRGAMSGFQMQIGNILVRVPSLPLDGGDGARKTRAEVRRLAVASSLWKMIIIIWEREQTVT